MNALVLGLRHTEDYFFTASGASPAIRTRYCDSGHGGKLMVSCCLRAPIGFLNRPAFHNGSIQSGAAGRFTKTKKNFIFPFCENACVMLGARSLKRLGLVIVPAYPLPVGCARDGLGPLGLGSAG